MEMLSLPLCPWPLCSSCLFCLIALAVACMLIAQGPLSSHHLHGQLDSEFNLLEGFVFHAHIKFKHPVRFNKVCVTKTKESSLCCDGEYTLFMFWLHNLSASFPIIIVWLNVYRRTWTERFIVTTATSKSLHICKLVKNNVNYFIVINVESLKSLYAVQSLILFYL